MRNAWHVARRELYAYFSSPIAYVTMAAFLGVTGLLFYLILVFVQQAVIAPVIGSGWVIFMVILFGAVVTMRQLAEEQRSGTVELLLTAPVRDWEVVVGKYLSGLGLFALMLVISLYQPFVLVRVGNPDVGVMLSSYVGFFLLGAAVLAIGTMTSTFTSNQVVAAILAIAFGTGLWLAEPLGRRLSGTLGEFVGRLAILPYYYDFLDGVISTRNVVYYLSLVVVSLFVATQVLQTRRWR